MAAGPTTLGNPWLKNAAGLKTRLFFRNLPNEAFFCIIGATKKYRVWPTSGAEGARYVVLEGNPRIPRY